MRPGVPGRCATRGEHLWCGEHRRGRVLLRAARAHRSRWARRAFIPSAWQEAEVLVPLFGQVEWSATWHRYVRTYRELYLSTGRADRAGLVRDRAVPAMRPARRPPSCTGSRSRQASEVRTPARMVELSALARVRVIKGAIRIVRATSYFAVMAGSYGRVGSDPLGRVH